MVWTLVKVEQASGPQRPGGFALPGLARFIVAVFPRAVGVLLLWAASLKVWDEAAVTRVLEFNGLSEFLIGPAISIIIIVESALGLMLILRPRLRWVLDGAVMVLSLYTLQLAWLASFREAPDCACLAAWEAYHSARFGNLMGIGRNVCLILPLLWVRSQVCGTGYQPVMSKDTGG